MKKTLTITALAAALALTGCGASDDTATEADKAPAGADTAKQVEGDLKEFFDCDWKDNTDEGDIVHTEVCEDEELMLAAGDKSSVKVWLDGMKEKAPGGYAVVSDEYVLTTTDKGTANHAWDVLGADGEVIELN
ncbi:hypothetical protein [Brevibacterium sp. SMBL_HHYL_HB1]|uniref:hypothetical protein n=1 Tax=Brevibacterium sp. SMBL_HHYL_HB1 TaxID=2777556 RepID=UPI001BA5D001|nr:hypothetical protein [Brevibacterium sp. SMBL_HHYL_HB1]QUL79913.1 hypothetical protein IG171_03450 [Brevibacterium sp. SMBL_HHYL_HB1]